MDYGLNSRFQWFNSERRLVETILTAELTYSSWGLRGRYELLRLLLQDDDYDKSDSNFWGWILVWFSYFTPTYRLRYRRRGGYISKSAEPDVILNDRETFLERSIREHAGKGRLPLEAPLIFQRGGSLQ